MKRIYLFIPVILLFFTFFSCRDHKIDNNKYGNCTDDITNQNEEAVDCGGVCSPCSSCDDGIQNNAETGIDCGGSCTSCTPPCIVTPATLDYTLKPSSSSFTLSGSESVYSAYYSNVNYDISINLSSGPLIQMRIEFKDNFDPVSFIPLNTTMVFTTLSYSTFNIDKINKVKITYYGSSSSFNGSVEGGYLIFITKISNTAVQIRFCDIVGSNGVDRLSINATTL